MNKVRTKLDSGQPVIGTFAKIPAPAVAEIVGRAGFDYVVVDLEPGFIGVENVENMIRAIEVAGSTPFVRVSKNDPALIVQAIEMGAMGIHVPMINTAEDAKLAVSAAKFPPLGARPMAPSCRAGQYGFRPAKDLFSMGNQEVLLIAHIEDKLAVQNLAEIISVAGVDIIYVGPNDLSQSYGVFGQYEHELMVKAYESVAATTRGSKVIKGTYLRMPDESNRWRKEGYQYLAISSDIGLLTASTRKMGEDFRKVFSVPVQFTGGD